MSGARNDMFFSGETESQAVLAAANHFGVAPDELVFDRMEKRHGFVKRRRVVIRVDSTRPAEQPPVIGEDARNSNHVAQPAVQGAAGGDGSTAEAVDESPYEAPAPTAPDEDDTEDAEEPDADELLEIARDGLQQLLELADLEVSAEFVLVGDRIEVELEGVDREVLLEEDGQVILALQHLLPRVMYGELGRIVPCRLDSGGYLQQKEDRLRGLARRVAEEVVQRGGTRTLRPMNPADRRVVHITLAEDPDVETESEGNGYFKRVSIRKV